MIIPYQTASTIPEKRPAVAATHNHFAHKNNNPSSNTTSPIPLLDPPPQSFPPIKNRPFNMITLISNSAGMAGCNTSKGQGWC